MGGHPAFDLCSTGISSVLLLRREKKKPASVKTDTGLIFILLLWKIMLFQHVLTSGMMYKHTFFWNRLLFLL